MTCLIWAVSNPTMSASINWETGAYTVQLNMQNYVWDGFKRDRLVWIGDMHPETMTINSVFGANWMVPRSLDLVRDETPLGSWMNGISSYSIWWLLIHNDWYRINGDYEYLKAQQPYLTGLLRQLIGCVDENGKEKCPADALDWPSNANPQAIHAGLHSLMILFDAGTTFATYWARKNQPNAKRRRQKCAPIPRPK